MSGNLASQERTQGEPGCTTHSDLFNFKKASPRRLPTWVACWEANRSWNGSFAASPIVSVSMLSSRCWLTRPTAPLGRAGRRPTYLFNTALRPDALGQCVDALDHYPAHAVMRILAHNLFLDPELVDRLVNTAGARPGCDYIGFRSRDGRPAILTADGLFGEWCRADALRRGYRVTG